MALPPGSSHGLRQDRADFLHRHITYGIRVHHLILTAAFLLLIALGVYFITSESQAVTRTAVSSYQQTELEIVRDAARSSREYVYVQTVVLNRSDAGNIEQEIFKKFIEPIHLLKNGDAWIYAPDHVVFDLSSDFPDEYRGRSMAQIFEIQKGAGASHYEEMTDDVMHAREGVGYYIWLPEKGEEIAAWTPVTVNNYTWTIGLSTPLPEILDATGASATTRTSSWVFVLGISIAIILFIAWLREDIRRLRFEEILRESEERYSAMVNNAPGPVLIVKKGEVRFINDAGVRASGYLRDEIIGKNILLFLTEDSQKTAREEAQFRAGRDHVSEYETEFIRKDGQVIQLIVRAIDISFQGEEVTLALLVDITGRKRADAALKTANKKLSLLSGITRHDIRNKLLILSGFVALAKDSTGDPARMAAFIRKEEDTIRNITNLITFTKDYEEMGIHSPAWQNIHAVTGRIIPQLPVRDIRIDTGDKALEVYADPLLERVFYNLIDNALRYGGEMMTVIRITHKNDNGNLVIAVEDDGTGIALDDKSKLFTRGFGKNTGLGLFLSREILSITGITIKETGEPGKGARFEITVPKGLYRFTDIK
ncbi:MAG: PAS domain-containing sensor histidine kinase [Methanoregula sp.]